jgi:hypothetical protein
MIGQQPESAETRIFDSHRALGTYEHFQHADAWVVTDLVEQPGALGVSRSAGIEHSRQPRPKIPQPRSPAHALDQFDKPQDMFARTGKRSDRHPCSSFCKPYNGRLCRGST